MRQHVLKLGCALLAIVAMSACSDSNKMSQSVVVPNPSGPAALSGFSTQFAAAYRADPNSEPYTPADGDVPAVSLTTEPVAVD